jgi:hypothetical protein
VRLSLLIFLSPSINFNHTAKPSWQKELKEKLRWTLKVANFSPCFGQKLQINQRRKEKENEKGNNLLITTLAHCAIHYPHCLSPTTFFAINLTHKFHQIFYIMINALMSSKKKDFPLFWMMAFDIIRHTRKLIKNHYNL